MRLYIFLFLLSSFVHYAPIIAMEDGLHLRPPESSDALAPNQKSWLVVHIPYPALDSGWRDRRPNAGEWSPELLKAKIMEMLEKLLGSRIKGRITAKYETIGRPRSRSVTEESQAGAPVLERGVSARALPLLRTIEAQTDPEPEIAEAPEPHVEEVGTDPAPHSVLENRYLIGVGSFLAGMLTTVLAKKK